jgi:hypothetical protein
VALTVAPKTTGRERALCGDVVGPQAVEAPIHQVSGDGAARESWLSLHSPPLPMTDQVPLPFFIVRARWRGDGCLP